MDDIVKGRIEFSMKLNILQIRAIIGLILVIVLGIIIFFMEPKENNEQNEKIYIEQDQIELDKNTEKKDKF